MNAFFSRPVVKKRLNFFFAYLLFALFGFLGLLLTVDIHSTAIAVCALLAVRANVAYFFYIWGAFILFGLYAIFIALIEPYMNKAAATNQVLKRGLIVFGVEASIALLTLLVPLLISFIR